MKFLLNTNLNRKIHKRKMIKQRAQKGKGKANKLSLFFLLTFQMLSYTIEVG